MSACKECNELWEVVSRIVALTATLQETQVIQFKAMESLLRTDQHLMARIPHINGPWRMN